MWVLQGFRKIDSDKWEFANEGFQRGKKHLLKNIRRRTRYDGYKKQQHLGMPMASEDLTNPVAETELQSLKSDNNILRLEMLKLREQQQDSQNRLTMVEERVRCAESKHQQMFSFVAKMSRNPGFCRQLVQRRMLRKKLNNGDEFGNQRRLLGVEPIDTFQVQEELMNRQSELSPGMFPQVIEPFRASMETVNESEDLIKKPPPPPQDCPSDNVQQQAFHGCVGSIP